MNLQEALIEYDNIIDSYRAIEFHNLDSTSELLKDLGVCLSYLTKERIRVQQQWNNKVFTYDGSNAAGEKYANEQHPELYQIRKIQEAGKIVWETMRSQISLLKQER